MRQNSEIFDRYNQAPSRELRLVIEIGYDLPLYLASHSDIPNLPANAVLGCIQKVSSTSQRLQPEKGNAEIGAISFEVLDLGGQVSYVLGDELANGQGLKGKRVRLYQGGAGMDWGGFRLEQTQVAEESLAYGEGVYKVRCRDIQRELRQDLFVPNSTKLAADFPVGATTLQVFDASPFEANPHQASYGDAPNNAGVYYLKIKYQDGYEIVRASGKTATSFTGCARGLFGTREVDHAVPSDSDSDRGIEIEEYIYIELPGPALAYALLTGSVPGTSDVLPGNWHLGIDPALVVLDDFENVGADWFNPADFSRGRILRFEGVEKTDGKKFIETEICLLLGAFMPVNAAGQLGIRRMTGVLANAASVGTLTAQDVVSAGDLRYDLAAVRNAFGIQWSWYEQPGFDGKFVRVSNLVDADSILTHGAAKPHTLKFRGLHNSRHTFTSIKHTFDALRDRFAGPPLRLTLDLLPSKNDIEVGDILQVTLPAIRDHSSPDSDTLDRAMEVQRVSLDQISGRVSVDLFGSYQAAGTISDQDSSLPGGGGPYASAELPDSWYSASGTEMTAAGLSIDGAGFLTADGSLSGGATRTIFYYLGDLTVPAGRTLTLSDNVELRIMGVLQIDGTLKASPSHSAAGFIGSTYGGGGRVAGKYGPSYVYNGARGERVVGKNQVMPALALENDAGDLQGIPDDLRGSGGASGGKSYYFLSGDNSWELAGIGGAGGSGGGGLAAIARGIAFGVSGKIETSGGGGSPGTEFGAQPIGGGSGGGGAPGGVVLLVDGNDNPLPILNDSRIVANYGSSPASPGLAGKSGGGLGTAAARVAFVPKSRTPYADESGAGLSASVQEALAVAAQAEQVADDAQIDATAALDDLGDIAADGVLHASEKLQVVREKAQLDAERVSLVAQANAFGLTSERDTFTGALDALGSYLLGLSPAWDDKSQSTSISRTLWDANWQAVYSAKMELLNAAAATAGLRADWAQIAGSGKPEDLATASGIGAQLGRDPSFELSALNGAGDYYNFYGVANTGEIRPDQGENGGAAMELYADPAGDQSVCQMYRVPGDAFFPARPGKRFYVRLRMKARIAWNGSGSNFRIVASFLNSGGAYVTNNHVIVGGDIPYTGSWFTLTGQAEVPADTSIEQVQFLAIVQTATAGSVLIDSWEVSDAPISFAGDIDATYGATAAQLQQVADAEQAAADAQSDASAAINELLAVSADDKLHPAEKKRAVPLYDDIVAERAEIEAQATAFGLAAERNTYTASVDNLTSYLGGLSPAWNDYTSITTITRNTWKNRWSGVYQSKQALLTKIAELASQRANWSQLSDDDGELAVVRSGTGVGFFNGIGGGHLALWTANGDTISEDGDAYSGGSALLIKTGQTAPSSSGVTDTAYLTIPEAIALQFGGRRVRVSLYAKQPGIGTPSTEFAVAYSTSDNGNSGWSYFTPTASWTRFDLVYDVPPPGSGNDDYVGVWASTSGGNKGVLIDSVSIEVIPKEADLDALNLGNADSIRNDNLTADNIKTGAGWASLPESGAISQSSADARISSLRPDNNYLNSNTTKAQVGLPSVNDFYVDNSLIDGRANSRISALRPDSGYKNSNLQASDVQDSFVLQYVGGRGANLNAPAYTRFLGYTLPPFGFDARSAPSLVASSTSPIGDTCMRIKRTDISNSSYLDLHPSGQAYFDLEDGKSYLLSAYTRSNKAHELTLRVFALGAGNDPGNAPQPSAQSIGTNWIRRTWRVTANASGGACVRLRIDGGAVNDYIDIDGIMVEEQVGDQTEPSALQQTGASYIDPYTGQPFDQRGIPQINSSAQSGTAQSALTGSDGGATATISIASHSVQYGFGTVSYGSGSITGLSFSTKHYVWCDDPGYAGGATTYVASTNKLDPISGTHRRYLGSITTPANGGGGTGGVPPGEDCVVGNMYLAPFFRARDAYVGDWVDAWDDGHGCTFPRNIEAIVPVEFVDCVRIVTESGAAVQVSMETPITLHDGRSVKAQHAIGGKVGVVHGDSPAVHWEKITKVKPIGTRRVYRISVGGISYAAGEDPQHRVITHNAYKP